MKYIRSPAWDGFWIAGGMWIGLALMVSAFFMPAYGRATQWIEFAPLGNGWPFGYFAGDPIGMAVAAWFCLAILLDTAHNFSPIILTWTDQQLRTVALTRWRSFLLVPGLIMISALAIGAATSLGWTSFVPGRGKMYYISYQWDNPFPLLLLFYVCWQVYHFGSQNFGVVSIYRHKWGLPGRRSVDKGLCLLLTAAFMGPPLLTTFRVPPGYTLLPPELGPPLLVYFFSEGIISAMHWLVAIGLCLKVTKIHVWLWLPALLLLGCIGFAWQGFSSQGTLLRAIPWIVSLRIGLGMVHFLYDGLIWRRGSPAIQAVLTPST